jgi:hypothetical protein
LTSNDYPALYRDADAASLLAQRKFLCALAGNLALLVGTAVLSFINDPAPGFGAAVVLALVGSTVLTIYMALGQPQRDWYGTRALAESIKTVTWRFMMKAEPYNGGEAAARDHFIANLKSIVDDNLLAIAVVRYAGGTQTTQAMLETRLLSLDKRKEKYDAERVSEQLSWYQRKAESNAKSARLWYGLLVILQGAGIIAAIGRVASPGFRFWPTDVFIAAAGSVIGWLQAKRFQELAASYSLTAHDIGLLQAKLPDVSSEAAFSAFVGDAENAFSREHTQWRARRDVD